MDRSCENCRFSEERERDERKELYCTEFCRWIGNTGKCGEWTEAKDGKSD